MQVSTSYTYDLAVSSFATQQQRISEVQQQISTGLKISNPHEDPSASVNIDRLQSLEGRLETYQRNVDTMNERLSLEDTSMSDMSNVYQRLRELTVQAGNTALPQESRLALAAEMRENLHSLAALGNTLNSQGHYSFGGAQADQIPIETFEIDGMVAASIRGDDTARNIEIAEGRVMQLGDNVVSDFLRVESNNALRTREELSNTGSAQAMSAFVSDDSVFSGQNLTINFDSVNTYDVLADDGTVLLADQNYSPGEPIEYGGVTTAIDGTPDIGDSFVIEPSTSKDAFTAVNQLIGVLRHGTDEQLTAMVDQSLTDINSLQEKLSVAQVETGSKLNSLEQQENNNADMSLFLTRSLSALRDTDYATAISQLQQEMTIFDAAQATFSRIQQSSLFDHI